MPGLVPGIHVFGATCKKDVYSRDIGGAKATPSFGRLCPAVTKENNCFALY
jgi:hypothetical protein